LARGELQPHAGSKMSLIPTISGSIWKNFLETRFSNINTLALFPNEHSTFRGQSGAIDRVT
jgi:hypothetical protein